MIEIILYLHILAGTVSLAAGMAALYTAKGAGVHRKSGMFFVYSMSAMGITGALIAALTGVETSVIAGLLAAYLVVTAFTTVRTQSALIRGINIAALFAGMAVAAGAVFIAFSSLAKGIFFVEGMPIPMLLLFGIIALLSSISDIRVISKGVPAKKRLPRHLWRMCFALFIASASFFLGQSESIPEPFRIMFVLLLLTLMPLVVMFYWLWRISVKKNLKKLILSPNPASESTAIN